MCSSGSAQPISNFKSGFSRVHTNQVLNLSAHQQISNFKSVILRVCTSTISSFQVCVLKGLHTNKSFISMPCSPGSAHQQISIFTVVLLSFISLLLKVDDGHLKMLHLLAKANTKNEVLWVNHPVHQMIYKENPAKNCCCRSVNKVLHWKPGRDLNPGPALQRTTV
jgi:hypothetical protein